MVMEEYDKCRKAGMNLNNKLMESKALSRDTIDRAVTLLGVKDKSGRAVYKSDIELHATMDFALCDLKADGDRTPVQAYMEDVGPANDVERILLEARIGSRTSLFRIEASDAKCTVDLSDQLHGGQNVTIHDRGLSMSTTAGLAMFARLFKLPRFNTTSGVSFLFLDSRVKALVRKYERMRAKPGRQGPVSRYALFFRMHRRYGLPAEFTD